MAIEAGKSYLDRITSEPDKLGGKPCIRRMRIRVTDILELLGAGMTETEILSDYPYLEIEDIRAALQYGALLALQPGLKRS